MKDKKILAFVGMPGAGKSCCVDHLTSKSIPSVYFGGLVVDEAIKRFGEASELHERQIREEFRAKDGMGAIAKRIIPKIDNYLKTHDRVVADGLYSWSEYKILKEYYGESLIVVAVAAPRMVRHERLAKRPKRPLSEVEVSSREYAEIENIEKGGPIANADYTLVNDRSEAELISNLKKLLKQIYFI